jgi:hypothetical protein
VVDVLLHLQGKLGIATAITLDLKTGFYFQDFAVPKIDDEKNKMKNKGVTRFGRTRSKHSHGSETIVKY